MKPNPIFFSALLLGLATAAMDMAHGQDTLRVRYHDFQAEHPDFGGPNDAVQNKCTAGLNSRMVQNILPANKIPLRGTNPLPNPNTASEIAECLDLNIASWFNPQPGNPGYHKSFNGYLLDQGARNDGLFEFDSQSFFPLDTVTGAQIYGNGHNNLFCMEVHEDFTYVGGEVFNFRGDDDVWLFINNRLAIDLGGIHLASTANLNLDAMAGTLGITKGNTYDFDFYFCERQYVLSSIRITTNIPIAMSQVARPIADPAGKAFSSQESVRLSTLTPSATIYYTTNGSVPDSNSTPYTGPILITSNTTLRAIAYRPGWNKSDVMTETYSKTSSQPLLEILDELGNPFQNGYITEKNTAYTVRITTTQAGLTTLNPVARTLTGLDRETLTIGNRQSPGDFFVFSGVSPFSVTTAAVTAANGNTQARAYDSLVVRWANPVDSLNEIAEKRILVRPAPKQAVAYFSTSATGTPATDEFAGTETTIYVFVEDQILRPGLVPKIVLVTTPKNGSGRTPDSDTLNMEATTTPGLYRVAIPVDISPVSDVGNDTLELAVEDQITATYRDPMDTESPAVANAGYGIAPEISASLQFTNKDWSVLPANFVYSPLEDSLYLTYRDDWVNGQILEKTVNLAIANMNNAPSDTESFVLKLVPGKKQGSTGVWEGAFPLNEGPAITKRNNIAESYIKGNARAQVASHSKAGGDTLESVVDDLIIAFQNQDPDIEITGSKGPGEVISRGDTGVSVTIDDQSLSSARDTIFATLSCVASADVVVNLRLIETEAASGKYVSEIISKSEGAAIVDGKLQCKDKDYARVTYEDPVFGGPKSEDVPIQSPVTASLFFSSTPDGKTPITSVSDVDADFIYVVVVGRSPTLDRADTLHNVTITTTQAEKETFSVVETGPYTETFVAKVPFAFISGVPTENDTLEGNLAGAQQSGFIIATGKATVEGAPVQGTINILAAFAPVDFAYIKDDNGDGRADMVYIVFQTKLTTLPASLSAQWNSSGSPGVAAPEISFLNSDSMVVVADFTSKPFPAGLTSIVDGQVPVATLPDDAIFKGQKPPLRDSIGPIILTAVKLPTNANTLVANDPNFSRDTLVITTSEPLKAVTDLRKMIKFSLTCADYDKAITLEAISNPVAHPSTPTKYIVIADRLNGETPLTGQCIFLNADPGNITDRFDNRPPEYGVVLTGEDGRKVIQLFRGYPPVAGLDPNSPTFQIAVPDSRDPKKSGYARPGENNTWEVVWVPPVGWTEGQTFKPYKVANRNETPSNIRESATPIRMPPGVSAVQIISTSAYIAHVTIFDIYGNFVNSSVQAFGWRGEMLNDARVTTGGFASYLVWDMKDKRGQMAGQGVYIWKVRFEFQNGKQEVQYTRTGVMR